MNAAYIVDAIRTPIGSFTGSLAPVRADDLAAHVIKALMDRHPGLDQGAIDDVIMGCANQAGEAGETKVGGCMSGWLRRARQTRTSDLP